VNRRRAADSAAFSQIWLGGDEHAAHLDVLALADGQAEEVLRDRLDGDW
jgi:hypothetical protein